MDPVPSAPSRQITLENGNEHALAFRDEYPVAEGHTLVILRQDLATVFDLTSQEQSALWSMITQLRARLQRGSHPDAFTIGVGVAAGRTVLHAQVQVIPRRHGDVPDPRGGVRLAIPGKAAYWRRP